MIALHASPAPALSMPQPLAKHAARRIPELSRRACRADAQARYGQDGLAEGYLAVYRAAIKRQRSSAAA